MIRIFTAIATSSTLTARSVGNNWGPPPTTAAPATTHRPSCYQGVGKARYSMQDTWLGLPPTCGLPTLPPTPEQRPSSLSWDPTRSVLPSSQHSTERSRQGCCPREDHSGTPGMLDHTYTTLLALSLPPWLLRAQPQVWGGREQRAHPSHCSW